MQLAHLQMITISKITLLPSWLLLVLLVSVPPTLIGLGTDGYLLLPPLQFKVNIDQ